MKKDVAKLILERKEIASSLNAGIKEAARYEKSWDKQQQIILYLDMAGYTIVKKRS